MKLVWIAAPPSGWPGIREEKSPNCLHQPLKPRTAISHRVAAKMEPEVTARRSKFD
jgi:hypothetical protein